MTEAEELELLELERARSMPQPTPSMGAGHEAQGAFGEQDQEQPRSNLFPSAEKEYEDRFSKPAGSMGQSIKDFGAVGAAAAGDIAGLAQRGAAALFTDQQMSDPGAHALKKSTDAAVQSSQEALDAHPEARNYTPPGGFGGMPMMMPTAEMAPALTEVGGRIIDDPITYAGMAAKGAGTVANKITEGKAALGEGLQKVGSSQMNRVVKPLMRHERNAKKPIEQVIFEQGFDKGEKGGGSPKAIYERSTEKLNELGKKLKAEIKAGRDGGARVNTDQLIDQVVTDLKANPGESEDFYSMAKDVDEIANDFKSRAQAANGSGDLDLLQAHSFKKYTGHEGAWQHIAKAKGIPLSAKETARAKVAEAIYHRLNDAIDAGAPNGIKDLNKQISEIIPVNQAAGWRQIVEGRGNAVTLGDVVGMTATAVNPKVWPVVLLNKATKSGSVASKIFRLGERMKADNAATSPRATKMWAALQKSTNEAQKARLITELEAEIAKTPNNVIPFESKKVAEPEEESPKVKKLRAAIENAKDEDARARLIALLDKEIGGSMDNTRYSRK